MSNNTKAACVLMIFSLLLFVWITPIFVEDPGMSGISPKYFPNFATVILFVSSLSLLIIERKNALKRNPTNGADNGIKTIGRGRLNYKLFMPLFIFAILSAYFLCFEYFGFLWSTPIFLALLMIVLGQRSYKIIICSSAVITYGLFQLFQKGLGLPLQ